VRKKVALRGRQRRGKKKRGSYVAFGKKERAAHKESDPLQGGSFFELGKKGKYVDLKLSHMRNGKATTELRVWNEKETRKSEVTTGDRPPEGK